MTNAASFLRFFPFLCWLQTYTKETCKLDLNAGLSGAIIALPQGVAFASIAGLPPEFGLYSAIVPAIIAALFGSSNHLITGSTTAISFVIYQNLSQFYVPFSSEYIAAAFSLALMTGIIQLLFAFIRLGTLVNFVSHSVVVGFTAGAAVLICFSQLGNFIGISLPAEISFYEKIPFVVAQADAINISSTMVAILALFIAAIFQRVMPKLPGMLIALVLGSVAAAFLGGADAGIKLVGAIPSQLPQFSLPDMSLDRIQQLGTSALAIAILALTEAVSISRSVAMHSHQRIDTNQEFLGQGLANIAGSFFSCYAASGSFTRTGVNFTAGARTPAAAIFGACFLSVILLLIAPVTAYLPIPAMAGVLMVVAYRLIDFHHIRSILKTSRSEFGIMAVTFFSTLFLNLEFAIYVGVLLSLILYIQKTAHPEVKAITLRRNKSGEATFVEVTEEQVVECPQIKVVRLRGEIYFGAINNIIEDLHKELAKSATQTKLLVVLKAVTFIDVAGCDMFSYENTTQKMEGREMYLCSLNPEVHGMLERAGVLKQLGVDHIFSDKKTAIQHLVSNTNTAKCESCKARIFKECSGRYAMGITPQVIG